MEVKTVIITGAGSGIGYEVAHGVAAAGHALIMACRNRDRAEPARRRLVEETGNSHIKLYDLDLASFDSVRRFCEMIQEDFPAIDVLINNAGVFTTDNPRTGDGPELTMQVNFLSPVLLTRLLLPVLTVKPGTRIVNVTSDAYRMGKISLDRVSDTGLKGINAYAASKYAVVLFTVELAERLKDLPVSVFAVHPGHVASGMWRFDAWYAPLMAALMKPFFKTPAEGAVPVLRAALAPELEGGTGLYFLGTEEKKVEHVDRDLRAGLWRRAGEIVGLDASMGEARPS